MDTPYMCPSCGKSFKLAALLNRHLDRCTGYHYKCHQCNVSFYKKDARDKHLKNHANIDNECQICKRVFHSKEYREVHTLKVHYSETRFSCVFCGSHFPNKKLLDQHTKSHIGEDQISCNQCDMVFADVKNYALHKREHHHNGNKLFTCVLCNKTFSSERIFNEHMTGHKRQKEQKCSTRKEFNAHSQDRLEKQYKCSECPKDFSRKRDLRSHIWKLHGKHNKPLQCDLCEKKFASPNLLIAHRRDHTGERLYPCKSCDKKFKTAQILRRHMEGVHSGEKKYKCDDCEQAFATRGYLTNHKKTVHATERKYKCKTCSKRFPRPGDLRSHEKVHSISEQERIRMRLQCVFCGKTFPRLGRLFDHIRRHIGERPFQCTLCANRYSSQYVMQQHKVTHTRVKP